jgi:hypothetical protein
MQTIRTSLPGPSRQSFAEPALPISSLKQLSFPAGVHGDFFGPGATLGSRFAAQIAGRFNF